MTDFPHITSDDRITEDDKKRWTQLFLEHFMDHHVDALASLNMPEALRMSMEAAKSADDLMALWMNGEYETVRALLSALAGVSRGTHLGLTLILFACLGKAENFKIQITDAMMALQTELEGGDE